MDLQAYLEGPGMGPWIWGTLDCIQFGCGWVIEASGKDPGAPFRGRYTTRTGAHRFILKAGGLVALIRPRMAEAGFERTNDPQSGDVGIVEVPVERSSTRSAVGAIRLGPYWAVRGEQHLAIRDFRTLAAWSIPQLR